MVRRQGTGEVRRNEGIIGLEDWGAFQGCKSSLLKNRSGGKKKTTAHIAQLNSLRKSCCFFHGGNSAWEKGRSLWHGPGPLMGEGESDDNVKRDVM